MYMLFKTKIIISFYKKYLLFRITIGITLFYLKFYYKYVIKRANKPLQDFCTEYSVILLRTQTFRFL